MVSLINQQPLVAETPAFNYLQTGFIKVVNDSRKQLDDLSKNMEKQSRQTNETIENVFNSSAQQMFIIIAIAAIFGIAMGMFIAYQIVKQLGGEPDYAADITRQIAAGNLMVDVETNENNKQSLLYAMKEMDTWEPVDSLGDCYLDDKYTALDVARYYFDVELDK